MPSTVIATLQGNHYFLAYIHKLGHSQELVEKFQRLKPHAADPAIKVLGFQILGFLLVGFQVLGFVL